MKTLLLVSILLLSSCGDFNPMSEGEAKAFDACIQKGWVPFFKATSSSRVVKCTRK